MSVSRTDIEAILVEVQEMWANPEIRNSVRLSQNALLRKLRERGLVIASCTEVAPLPHAGWQGSRSTPVHTR